MQKPIDRWLGLFSIVVGIIMTFIPHTLPYVMVSLTLIFLLLSHIIWNFWWVEKYLWRRIIALFLVAACLFFSGYVILPKNDVFKCNFNVVMRFGYPGDLLMRYPSALGDTASCPNIALYVEVINTLPTTATRILSYRCRALLKYDEGGQIVVSDNTSGGWKYEYKPSGRVVEKWQTLHSMGILGNNVYFLVSPLKKWKRIDFTRNGFDKLASSEQMPPGGSIKGWILLEFENDELRLQMPEIKEIELTLWNSVGQQEICLNSHEIKLSDDVNNLMRAGDWRLEAGLYDFTKDKFTIVPMVDLPKTLKEGGQFLKSKGKGYEVLNYQGLKHDK